MESVPHREIITVKRKQRCLEAALLSFFFTLFDAAAVVAQLIVTEPVALEIRADIAKGRFGDIVKCFLRQESLM